MMTSGSSNSYTNGLPTSTNAPNPSSFAYYYGIEQSIPVARQPNSMIMDPFMGNRLQAGHSAEYSYMQSYARQAAAHSDVAASIGYAVPQFPVYAVVSPTDDPYGMSPGMLNAAGQMYSAMQPYHQPATMEGSALMAAESAPTDARNYKKVQCRHFAAGMCVRGATCGFKHGEHDTGSTSRGMVLPRMVPMMSHMNAGKPFRVVPCQHWLAGNCRKGMFCTFRHEFPAVNPTVSSSSQQAFTQSDSSTTAGPPTQFQGNMNASPDQVNGGSY
jgi:hypothetical protein